MGEDVQKRPHQVETLSGDIRNLKDRAYPSGDELSCSIDALLAVLDEDGNFASSWRLENFGQLRDGLVEDVGRTNVDFGYHDHDRHIESKRDPEVFLGHANQTIICGNHEEAVIGFAAEEAEDGGSQIALVAGEVGEADDFGLLR